MTAFAAFAASSRRSEPRALAFSRDCDQIVERDEFERVVREGQRGAAFTEGHRDVAENNDRDMRDRFNWNART